MTTQPQAPLPDPILYLQVWPGDGQSSGCNPNELEQIILAHQQEMANESGKSATWEEAVRDYFSTLEESFQTLVEEAQECCMGFDHGRVEPGEGA